MRTPGTPRDNLLPRASSEFRAVVTKASRTAEEALYSSPGLQQAVLQDRHEGAGAQQRDGALQSSTESSAEGIAALHRVTLAVRVICQVRGRLHHLGSDPSRAGRPHTGHRWPDRRSHQPRTLQARYASWACHCFTSEHRPPTPQRRRLGQAKRSEELDGTAANQWQPAQVAIKPGGTVTFRTAGGQTHPVGPARRRPGQAVRRLQLPAPHLTKLGDACTVRFPKAGTYPFFRQVHHAHGMKGVITVGSGGGSGPTTTAATAAGSNVAPVTTPKAAAPPRPAKRPSTRRAGAVRPWCPARAGAARPLRARHPVSTAQSASNRT